MLPVTGPVATVDGHCETVSEKANRHSGARSTGAHSCNTGMLASLLCSGVFLGQVSDCSLSLTFLSLLLQLYEATL